MPVKHSLRLGGSNPSQPTAGIRVNHPKSRTRRSTGCCQKPVCLGDVDRYMGLLQRSLRGAIPRQGSGRQEAKAFAFRPFPACYRFRSSRRASVMASWFLHPRPYMGSQKARWLVGWLAEVGGWFLPVMPQTRRVRCGIISFKLTLE